MGEHRPHQLTEHSSPPFRPHTPDAEHESTLFHRPSTNRLEHAIQEILFGNAKIQKHAVEKRVHEVQQRDLEHHDKIAMTKSCHVDQRQQQKDGDPALDLQRNSRRCSPSSEAREADTQNKNGFGDEGEDGDGWGWPGLGTWQGGSAQGEARQRKAKATGPGSDSGSSQAVKVKD